MSSMSPKYQKICNKHVDDDGVCVGGGGGGKGGGGGGGGGGVYGRHTALTPAAVKIKISCE